MSKNAPHSDVFESHKKLEKNVTLLGAATLLVVAIGGIVEIAPLFWIDNTIEKVEGMRPYTPLEHGHYSLAAESMYDHPFQWGSKRTGPDLARVGGKYSDDWHVQHLKAPRSVVPESIMPNYSFLAETDVTMPDPAANLTALRRVGVPYSDTDIAQASTDLMAQANPDADAGDLATRYPKAQIRDFDGDPKRVTEMDALVAYLQMLGTLVDVNSAAAQEQLSKEKGR